MHTKIFLTLPVLMPIELLLKFSKWSATDGEPLNVYAIEYLRRTDSHMFDGDIYL